MTSRDGARATRLPIHTLSQEIGDCIGDITESEDVGGTSPVNLAGTTELHDSGAAIPD